MSARAKSPDPNLRDAQNTKLQPVAKIMPQPSAGDKPIDRHPRGSIYVEHVHKLLELADRYQVHVESTLRNDMFKLQDAVIYKMHQAAQKDPF